MLAQSILTRTLVRFIGSGLAAILAIGTALWRVIRRAKKTQSRVGR